MTGDTTAKATAETTISKRRLAIALNPLDRQEDPGGVRSHDAPQPPLLALADELPPRRLGPVKQCEEQFSVRLRPLPIAAGHHRRRGLEQLPQVHTLLDPAVGELGERRQHP